MSRSPGISADCRRIACGSELGTLYVHATDGKSLLARDRGAWPIPAWLPDGDLLVVGWTGRIARLSGEDFSVRWTKQLESGNFVTARTCGLHDHLEPDNASLKGRIIVR